MDDRYRKFAAEGVKKLESYNRAAAADKDPLFFIGSRGCGFLSIELRIRDAGELLQAFGLDEASIAQKTREFVDRVPQYHAGF